MAGDFRISSQKLRIWNEVATILLIAIVMLSSGKAGNEPGLGFGRIAVIYPAIDVSY